MSEIHLLIVDDDKILVEKLEKTMHWSAIGVDKVYTAYNIRQAKAIIIDNPINLLLSDIDMPQGSGLELVEWIREEEREIECVFLSSYANFSYAQMALKLSSRDYILKPTSNKNLENALLQVIEEMQKNNKDNSLSRGNINFYWNEFLSMKCDENVFLKNISGFYPDNLKIRFLSLVSWGQDFPEVSKLIDALYMMEAESRISNSEVLLVSLVDKEPVDERAIYDIGKALNMSMGEEMGIFCGEPYELKDIGTAMSELMYLRRHAVIGESGVVRERQYKEASHTYLPIYWEILSKDIITTKSVKKAEETVLETFELQYHEDGWSRSYLEQFKLDLYMMFDTVIKKMHYDIDEIFIRAEYQNYVEHAKSSITGTRALIRYMFSRMDGKLNQADSENNVVFKIKKYIDENLQDNLSRSVLSQHVYLSEDYIAKLFQKEEGTSLSNYIAAKRIEKAMDYLLNTDASVSSIALEVGYNNFSYFSKSFREQTGCTPNEFRIRNKK